MNGFVKPTIKNVSDSDYITKLVNANLHKDLHDNEEICQHCHGTGMVVVDNPYGLSDDPEKHIGNMFPYKHQSISFCPHCYNGIVHRCSICGNLIKRGFTKCDCDGQKAIDSEKRRQKLKEELDNAPIAPKEIEDSMECFYSDCYGYNEGYFFGWDEFFDYWFENEPGIERPEFVWITEPVEMSIDAMDIIENAIEDLYEDAIDSISDESRKELQEYLDSWCKTCGVGTTYYESHKYKVRIPWESADDYRN